MAISIGGALWERRMFGALSKLNLAMMGVVYSMLAITSTPPGEPAAIPWSSSATCDRIIEILAPFASHEPHLDQAVRGLQESW